jgi:hypothetical protein
LIELLAITDDPAEPEPPLRAVRSGTLSVLCAPAVEHEVTAESLWRREALIEGLMEERDLLPVRFGTLVPDDRAAASAVAERRDELLAGLERVRGAVELGLRVEPRESRESPAKQGDGARQGDGATPSGREYLRAKLDRLEVARTLHEPLALIARAAVVQPGRPLLRAAYLVDRGAVDEFVAAVRRLQQAHPELALLCTGPWPPYSFAEEVIEP